MEEKGALQPILLVQSPTHTHLLSWGMNVAPVTVAAVASCVILIRSGQAYRIHSRRGRVSAKDLSIEADQARARRNGAMLVLYNTWIALAGHLTL